MHINIYVRTYVGDPWLGTLLIPLKCNMEQSRAQGASLTMQSRSGEPITSFRGGHFFLSNMYPCPCGVEFDGEIYDYSENAFQAAKTNPWRSQAALTPCEGNPMAVPQCDGACARCWCSCSPSANSAQLWPPTRRFQVYLPGLFQLCKNSPDASG